METPTTSVKELNAAVAQICGSGSSIEAQCENVKEKKSLLKGLRGTPGQFKEGALV